MPNPELRSVLRYPRITTCLAYRNPGATPVWLKNGIGFNNRVAPGKVGRINHGNQEVEEGMVTATALECVGHLWFSDQKLKQTPKMEFLAQNVPMDFGQGSSPGGS